MYDHDITHCNNENCKNKDTCYRYIANLDELRKKPHKSSVCGMNCVFLEFYLFISKLFVIFVI